MVHVDIFVKENEHTYLKGRALMYKVVPTTKRGNCRFRASRELYYTIYQSI